MHARREIYWLGRLTTCSKGVILIHRGRDENEFREWLHMLGESHGTWWNWRSQGINMWQAVCFRAAFIQQEWGLSCQCQVGASLYSCSKSPGLLKSCLTPESSSFTGIWRWTDLSCLWDHCHVPEKDRSQFRGGQLSQEPTMGDPRRFRAYWCPKVWGPRNVHPRAASHKLLFVSNFSPSLSTPGVGSLIALIHLQEPVRREMWKGDQMPVKSPSGRKDLLSTDCGFGPELRAQEDSECQE